LTSLPARLTIALSKGRILKEALPLLAAVNLRPAEDPATSRKLLLATNRPDIQLVIPPGQAAGRPVGRRGRLRLRSFLPWVVLITE
jgi:ATP phosphoribosyltransferase